MSAYVVSSLVGGDDGDKFSDILYMKDDGNFILNNKAKDTLDVDHPINEIHLRIGPNLTYIAIEYQLANGSTTKLVHGTKLESDDVTIVRRNHSLKYMAVLVLRRMWKVHVSSRLHFPTKDKVTEITREHGPFGSNSTEGTNEFSSSESGGFLAFGGFVTKGHNSALSGLFFLNKKVPF
ncbi:hypothetical protein C8Q74DRAFT_1452905 [Fomes fomentarius]|nr:hypothetical protein C8Q74DRAFT_1452905 [Fomes fomentarius]